MSRFLSPGPSARGLFALVFALVCLLSVVAGCSGEEAATAKPLFCSPKIATAPCGHARVGVEYPVALWSHCGVSQAYFGGRYWVIEPAQPEGANYLDGVMTIHDSTLAEFRSKDRRFHFKPAPNPFSPPLCY